MREITDGTVLDEVFRRGRVTRAELATSTGISKPTISESVRRLQEAGLLRESGTRTGRRGRVASFYELDLRAGWVLALEVSQAGLHSSAADLAGREFDSRWEPPVRSGDTDALIQSLRRTARQVLETGRRLHGELRAVSLSVANPVDPTSREIIALPNSPFPEGLVRPHQILADLLEAPLLIDNDVNFAALAERRSGAAREASSFAYLHVGAGLGMAYFLQDQLLRGAHGLAGEIGYLPIRSVDGRRASLAVTLARQGFGRPDAPSIDVVRVTDMIEAAVAGEMPARTALALFADTLAQAIAAICAVNDPELVILDGPIGNHPALQQRVRDSLTEITTLPVRVEGGQVDRAALRGAVHLAVDTGRSALLTG
nr:ROK family transcriptional regulator [Microlunatus panaciterrae]